MVAAARASTISYINAPLPLRQTNYIYYYTHANAEHELYGLNMLHTVSQLRQCPTPNAPCSTARALLTLPQGSVDIVDDITLISITPSNDKCFLIFFDWSCLPRNSSR